MPLIDCLECKKQISDQAPACIHCGMPLQLQTPVEILPDNSNLRGFNGYLKDGYDKYKYVTFFGINQEDAVKVLLWKNPGYTISEAHKITKLTETGKYSCPSCKARFTTCAKKIGCAIMIIIFISLGLGLIMIPFLPHHCECRVCGHKWKS